MDLDIRRNAEGQLSHIPSIIILDLSKSNLPFRLVKRTIEGTS